MWPCRDAQGEWHYQDVMGRMLDKAKFEEFKTTFYRMEDWDVESGWPTRKLLARLDMRDVADVLEAAGRLGKERS
jgi:aldehyde:ferredoxin oxidoreductase